MDKFIFCEKFIITFNDWLLISYLHNWCRTEQLLAAQGASPERMGTNGHELALFSQALENAQNPHLSGVSNNLVRYKRAI